MCHENEMGAAKEQHPYIICRLDKQRRWNSGGTVTRPLFICYSVFAIAVFQSNATHTGCNALKIPVDVKFTISI